MFKIIIAVIAVTIVGLVVFMAVDPNQNNTTDNTAVVSSSSNTNNTNSKYNITIEGEVNAAGTYAFNTDTVTMADLIEAAGGLTSSADEYAFIEESELKTGKTYYIASKYDSSNVCSLVEVSKVNINTDTAEQLVTVSGFTTSIANSVVSYRTENGNFKTIEDLLEVYGIGNATYRRVRNYVVLRS